MTKSIYIAGPMSGIPEFNFPAFFATAERLEAEGWHVWNPANKELERSLDETAYADGDHVRASATGFNFREAYLWDLTKVVTSDAIFMLKGWERSPGAIGEHAAGPEADDRWKDYEVARGRTYQEALQGHAARNVFAFDKRNLDRCTHALLVLPAGKSGHMEIMYATYGVGAKTAILLDPDDVRWDVMYQFVPTVLNNDGEIPEWLNSPVKNSTQTSPGSISLADLPLKVLPWYWASVPESTQPTTGEAALNTHGSLARPSDISMPSTMAKTSTRKAR